MTAALEGVSGQQHAPAALHSRESPGTDFTGGWVGPRAGLDVRNSSSPLGFDLGPCSPVAQSLYRLIYRAQYTHMCVFVYIYIYICVCVCVCLVNFTLEQTTMSQRSRRGIALLFL